MAKQNWQSTTCRKLVRHYLARKPAVMAGQTRPMRKPKFIAGMLLRVHGIGAMGAFQQVQSGLGEAWPAEVGPLLKKALNAELRAVHGQVRCKFCERQAAPADDLLDWMTTVKQAWWACPPCTAAQGLAEGTPVDEPN